MIARRAFAVALLALAAPAFAQPSSGGGNSGASRAQQRLTSADSFVPMPTFSTAVVVHSRARGTIVVDAGLDVPDATLRRRARSLQPRLVDALRTALSTYAATYHREQAAPDPDTLSRLMQGAVDRTLGTNGARVLLANIIYQRRAA